mmetsp:Transcript_83399/g.268848  ORF Transcript_83399/g.268848 Transcript_83399/m.268848 type:complete len:290 (-) Transcript_83399:575-1444(-)
MRECNLVVCVGLAKFPQLIFDPHQLQVEFFEPGVCSPLGLLHDGLDDLHVIDLRGVRAPHVEDELHEALEGETDLPGLRQVLEQVVGPIDQLHDINSDTFNDESRVRVHDELREFQLRQGHLCIQPSVLEDPAQLARQVGDRHALLLRHGDRAHDLHKHAHQHVHERQHCQCDEGQHQGPEHPILAGGVVDEYRVIRQEAVKQQTVDGLRHGAEVHGVRGRKLSENEGVHVDDDDPHDEEHHDGPRRGLDALNQADKLWHGSEQSRHTTDPQHLHDHHQAQDGDLGEVR